MPLDLVIGKGLVGSILSYSTGEVLADTSSPGQAHKITSWHDHAKIERGLVLIQELFRLLNQVVQFESSSCF